MISSILGGGAALLICGIFANDVNARRGGAVLVLVGCAATFIKVNT